MKVCVYKEYNDSQAYGEEFIKVFAEREDALKFLKERVEKYELEGKCTFEEFKRNGHPVYHHNPDDTIEDDYVSIDNGNGVTFYIVEYHEVN